MKGSGPFFAGEPAPPASPPWGWRSPALPAEVAALRGARRTRQPRAKECRLEMSVLWRRPVSLWGARSAGVVDAQRRSARSSAQGRRCPARRALPRGNCRAAALASRLMVFNRRALV